MKTHTEVVWCHTIDGTKNTREYISPVQEAQQQPSQKWKRARAPVRGPPRHRRRRCHRPGRRWPLASQRGASHAPQVGGSQRPLAAGLLQQTQAAAQQPLQQEQQDKKAAATQLPRVMPTLEPAELPRLLHEHGAASTSVAEYVAWRMRGLSTLETQELASCGGIYAILEVMRAHPANVSIQEDCCGAFARFSACDSGCRDSVIASGAVGQIQQAMSAHRTEAELQEAAIASLATISVGDEPSEGSVVATCLPAVVDAMRTHPHRLDLQRSGCSLLYYISAGSDEGRTEVCSAKGIEAVASAMRAHPECMSLLADGCGTLCSLVLSDDPRCAYAVVAMRAVDAVVEAMLAAPGARRCSGGAASRSARSPTATSAAVATAVASFSRRPPTAFARSCARWTPTQARRSSRSKGAAHSGASPPRASSAAARSPTSGRRRASWRRCAGTRRSRACRSRRAARCAPSAPRTPTPTPASCAATVASAHEALLAHPHELSVQRTAISLLAILAAFDESVAARILAAGAPYAAVTAIGEHPNDAGLLRAACHLLLASWPFDLPSPDLPTGEGSADEAAAARASRRA